MLSLKKCKFNIFLLIIFSFFAQSIQATTFRVGTAAGNIGPFYLIAHQGGMVFYVNKASIKISSHQTIAATYLVQHEASTDDTRSMVNHVQVNCMARSMKKIQVTHWTGNWGDGLLVITEQISNSGRSVGTRGIQSKLVSFICASVSLT